MGHKGPLYTAYVHRNRKASNPNAIKIDVQKTAVTQRRNERDREVQS
jgi:hypothetical protein